MSGRDDGGGAFPLVHEVEPPEGFNGRSFYIETGMSLRDYFATHAPVKPWPFYEPTMPSMPPLGLAISDDGQRKYENATAAEYSEGDNWSFEGQQARNNWSDEKDRQYWIQWPWFYADAMLAARK